MTILICVIIAVKVILLGYIVLVMPRIFNKPNTKGLDGYLYAHRGFHHNSGDAPENSLLACQYAKDKGYGIEIDVQLTKDEKVVVFHDDTLDRVCNAKGKIKDFTYEELKGFKLYNSQQGIPLLQDVLDIMDAKTPIIVEIKHYNVPSRHAELTNEIMKNYKGAYCIESFHPVVVGWYKKNRPDIIRGQLSSNFAKDFKESGSKYTVANFAVQHLLTNIIARPDFIAYNHHYPKSISRRLCSLFGALRVTWTIKSQSELENAKKHFDYFIFEGFEPK